MLIFSALMLKPLCVSFYLVTLQPQLLITLLYN